MPDNVFDNYAKSQGIPSKTEVLALLNQKLYDPQIVNNFPYIFIFVGFTLSFTYNYFILLNYVAFE